MMIVVRMKLSRIDFQPPLPPFECVQAIAPGTSQQLRGSRELHACTYPDKRVGRRATESYDCNNCDKMSRAVPQFGLSHRGARRLLVCLLSLLSLSPLDLVQGQFPAPLPPVPVPGTASPSEAPAPSSTDTSSLQPDNIRATVERFLGFQIPWMGQISLEGTPTTA
jgi:hypothetical protein